MVRLARAVADPHHVAGGRVPVAGGGIVARHRLLEAEQQCLVAGVEFGDAHFRVALGVDPAGAHEVERLGDPPGKFRVARRLRAVLDEAQHPAVRVVEVGVAAGRERPQQVERRRRLPICLELAPRIGHPCGLREGDVVDDVAAVAGQRHPVLRLGVRRARLGELARHPPDLHHRQRAREGQHHRHLEEHAEEVADVIGGMLGERFRAVAPLQQKRLAGRHPGERRFQLARLAGEDQRREARQLLLDLGEHRSVRIARHLLDRLLPPACRAPSVLHRVSLQGAGGQENPSGGAL